MNNPFIAPDIKETVNDKARSKHQALLMLACGAILVAVLLGGYYSARGLGLFEPTQPEQVVEVPVIVVPDEQKPLNPTREERLAELNEGGTSTPLSVDEVRARLEELEDGTQGGTGLTSPTREERIKELQ